MEENHPLQPCSCGDFVRGTSTACDICGHHQAESMISESKFDRVRRVPAMGSFPETSPGGARGAAHHEVDHVFLTLNIPCGNCRCSNFSVPETPLQDVVALDADTTEWIINRSAHLASAPNCVVFVGRMHQSEFRNGMAIYQAEPAFSVQGLGMRGGSGVVPSISHHGSKCSLGHPSH